MQVLNAYCCARSTASLIGNGSQKQSYLGAFNPKSGITSESPLALAHDTVIHEVLHQRDQLSNLRYGRSAKDGRLCKCRLHSPWRINHAMV